eukprot:m.167959 g.167959  ORF g.167959 m.167959 type:complete len:408 (-) comp12902_c0_seq1:47-1270(-)
MSRLPRVLPSSGPMGSPLPLSPSMGRDTQTESASGSGANNVDSSWPTHKDSDGGPAVLHPEEQMASSMVGAILTSLLVTPFDVVKTRLQYQASEWAVKSVDPSKCGECGRRIFILQNGLMEHVFCSSTIGALPTNCKPAQPKFTGTIDAFTKIWRHEGPGALWRGLPPTLIMAVPQTVIYFTAYDQLKSRFGADNPYYAPLVAGPVARTFAVTVISPIEMVRTKIQADTAVRSTRDYMNLIAGSVRSDGIGSLWRGLGATLLRDVPFSALYWFGYEQLKPRLMPYMAPRSSSEYSSSGDAGSLPASFAAGALSGTVAAAITLPFDVVKTRQQTTLGETIIGVRSKCGGAGAIMREIVQKQGVAGLFVGLTPRIAKVAPACAIMISTYEAGKSFFAARRAALTFPITG